jgi:hypothetical protein
MKNALGDDKTYIEFPRKALFDKIGMRNTLLAPTDLAILFLVVRYIPMPGLALI